MPTSIGAENRIRALLFGGAKPNHPTTITGSPSHIDSYRLTIVYADGPDAFLVKTHRNSTMTTNRHIQAAYNVLTEAGYMPTEHTENIRGGGPYNPYSNQYTRWEKRA